ATDEADDAPEPEHRDVGGRDVLSGREDEDRQEERDERPLQDDHPRGDQQELRLGNLELTARRGARWSLTPRRRRRGPHGPFPRDPRRLRPMPTPSSPRRRT